MIMSNTQIEKSRYDIILTILSKLYKIILLLLYNSKLKYESDNF